MTILDPKRRRFAANVARTGFAVSALAFASALVNTVPGADRVGAATGGIAQIIVPATDVGGGGAPLDGGDSSTPFGLRLPDGAACGGDSSDGYRVQGYLVADAIDPSTLTFNNEGPMPTQLGSPQATFRQPLYDSTLSVYIGFPADETEAQPPLIPAAPPTVVNIPGFTLGVYEPGNIPAGTYNVGIACVSSAAVPNPIEEYWNARITVVASTADTGPSGITWTAEEPLPTTTTSASSTTTAPSTTTTTTPGGSTTTTTTAPGGTTTTIPEAVLGGGVGPLDGPVAALTLPRTGGSLSVAWWGALMVIFGRMAVLLGRKPKVLPSVA